MKRAFTLEYWQDDGWYVGKLREVPGVFSQGETLKKSMGPDSIDFTHTQID